MSKEEKDSENLNVKSGDAYFPTSARPVFARIIFVLLATAVLCAGVYYWQRPAQPPTKDSVANVAPPSESEPDAVPVVEWQ